jgi:PKD repeat protein
MHFLGREEMKRTLACCAVIVLLIQLSFCFVIPVRAAEPALLDVLNTVGFTNIVAENVSTFPAGSYNITLYAEFACLADTNELSYYQVGTDVYNMLFTGPEGGHDYLSPPISKVFNTTFEFGLSLFCEGIHRYFTENNLNPDGYTHSKVYRNLDDPRMFLIGFENLYGSAVDRDFQDMVFSIRARSHPNANFTWLPLLPVDHENVTFTASNPSAGDSPIVEYSWNFGDGNSNSTSEPEVTHAYLSPGDYNVTLVVTDSEGLTSSQSKIITIATSLKHDIAILSVTISTSHQYVGRTVNITITVKNNGDMDETFNVMVYRNATSIGTIPVSNLMVGENRTIILSWITPNLPPYQKWTINAQAPLTGDINPSDNVFTDGTFYVKMIGDVNADGRIDILDVVVAAAAYHSTPKDPNWNPQADLAPKFGLIDILDIVSIVSYYGTVAP